MSQQNIPLSPVWSNHELVLLRPQPHEGEVVGGVDLLEHGPRLLHQLVDQPRVLRRGVAVQGGLDGDAVAVDNDRADHALVGHEPLQRLLDLGGHLPIFPTLFMNEAVEAGSGETFVRSRKRGSLEKASAFYFLRGS